jgi:2-C-methyl-D-erythritol 4-phosphate cytidylyltransferase/2-C-methyl-D-erythritol 2,4-cyclodiphosphate synthase
MTDEKIVCLVAAAGKGKRFGRETPKIFHEVEGLTLLVRSLKSLGAWDGITRFVVMVPEGWEKQAEDDLAENFDGIEATVMVGGETRQESVAIGLEAAGDADIILVHDAARPFVSAALIKRVVEGARETGAAVPALHMTDTLGRLRGEELEAIVPRDKVVGIQTPQGFRTEVLRKAFEAAKGSDQKMTDESSLVLAAGMPVRVVDGERWNVKVTVKDDIDIVTSFLSGTILDLECLDEG